MDGSNFPIYEPENYLDISKKKQRKITDEFRIHYRNDKFKCPIISCMFKKLSNDYYVR